MDIQNVEENKGAVEEAQKKEESAGRSEPARAESGSIELVQAKRLKEKEDEIEKREMDLDKREKDFVEFMKLTERGGKSRAGNEIVETEEERKKREVNDYLKGTGLHI